MWRGSLTSPPRYDELEYSYVDYGRIFDSSWKFFSFLLITSSFVTFILAVKYA